MPVTVTRYSRPQAFPRTAVRLGASWTAAYHLQLTVAVVAKPVRSSVRALGVLAAERSWLLLAQTTSARRSVQPVSRGRAWSPWSTLLAGKPRRRSPVSSMRCPPIRIRRPGSGCPAVRCPVTWGRRPAGPAVGRLLSTHPASSRPLSTRPVSSRLVSAPVGPDASVSSHAQAVAFGDQVEEAGTRAMLPKSGWSVGGRWGPGRRVGCGPRRPRLTAERPGRPGRRAERPSRAAARWARVQAAARGGGTRRVAAILGWVRDHGGWSSPSLTPGWAAPEGPLEVPARMGVRPQRGPSRHRTRPAGCRQRSDLRRWVVGLPGLEPGTSSLSGTFAGCVHPGRA
jgi:hypothetical protein